MDFEDIVVRILMVMAVYLAFVVSIMITILLAKILLTGNV